MQPQVEVRSVHSSGVSSAGAFGMKAENSAHIFGILRNQLYSNKVLAVLREYSANAWDEHRAAGIPDRPIQVSIPTVLEPTLRIRDYGRGLSEEDVFGVYTQYGSSTKRQSDDVVGCLGIGSKSAFAYADTFTVTSWHGGLKSIYVAVLDESNVGTMSLLWRGPCAASETGIEIAIPVQIEDIPLFQRESLGLFEHFNPQPQINITVPASPRKERSIHGGFGGQGWVAVMGCIPYPMDVSQLQGLSSLFDMKQSAGILRFDIGEISIAASREALEYTPRTKEAIRRRLMLLIADLKKETESIIANESISPWQRRLTVRNFYRFVGNSHLQIDSHWASPSVGLYDSLRTSGDTTRTANTFEMRRSEDRPNKPSAPATSVWVMESARIVVRDVARSPTRCGVSSSDHIIYPRQNAPIDQVLVELNACLEKANLTGIPVVMISSLPYIVPARNTTRAPKHSPKVHQFELNISQVGRNLAAPSCNWTAVQRTPQDDDLFFIIQHFQPVGSSKFEFSAMIENDRFVTNWLGGTLPPIYGYRHQSHKPINAADCKGKLYTLARKELFRAMLEAKPERYAELQRQVWLTMMRHHPNRVAKEVLASLADFPDGHLAKSILESVCHAVNNTKVWLSSNELSRLCEAFPDAIWEAQAAFRDFYKKYPHMSGENKGPGFWGLTNPVWVQYLKIIDQHHALSEQP